MARTWRGAARAVPSRGRAGGYQFPEWMSLCSFLPPPPRPCLSSFLPSFPFPPELSVNFASTLCEGPEKEGENMEVGSTSFVHIVLYLAPVVVLQAISDHEEEFDRVGSFASRNEGSASHCP